MVRPLAILAALALVMRATTLAAHPLHSSFTEITHDRSGRLMVSIKVFTDDFNGVLETLTRDARSPRTVDSVSRRYVEQSFVLRTSDGSPVSLIWCGLRLEGNQLVICVMSSDAVRGRVRVTNALLFDRFADQVNIVRWTTVSRSRIVVFSRGRAEVTFD